MKIMCPENVENIRQSLKFLQKTEIGTWLTIWYFKITLEVKFTKNFEHKLGSQKDLEIIYKVNKVI